MYNAYSVLGICRLCSFVTIVGYRSSFVSLFITDTMGGSGRREMAEGV